MSFTKDQYSQIAQGYDKAATDPLVSAEKRTEFAQKAEWFRFLARRESETHRSNHSLGESETTRINSESVGQRRRMAPFLATLWISGAVVYLIGTVLFTNAVNLFEPEDHETLIRETKQPVEPLPKATSVDGSPTIPQANLQNVAAAERRHAISPDEPSYEDPALTLPSTPSTQERPKDFASEPNVDIVGDEVFRVTAAATIRNGPSASAKKIGTATAGAELKVRTRQKDWVQFVDPSSGNTGWIQASLVAPALHSEEALPSPQPTDVPAKPAKPKLAEKKPAAPVKRKQRPAAYAGLPSDEEFLPPKKRGGPLSRRRMLREGLMSPGFLPPH